MWFLKVWPPAGAAIVWFLKPGRGKTDDNNMYLIFFWAPGCDEFVHKPELPDTDS